MTITFLAMESGVGHQIRIWCRTPDQTESVWIFVDKGMVLQLEALLQPFTGTVHCYYIS